MQSDMIERVAEWYCSDSIKVESNVPICPTRDLFQARLDTLYQETVVSRTLSEEEAALFTAAVGEIGNNCFDHNLGQWQDLIGCWFSWTASVEEKKTLAIIADRGQGVLNSLKRVKPELNTESEALKTAFEQKLSGRSPEHRGNGLKFVRSVINQHERRGLLFFSGAAKISFGGSDLADLLDTVKIMKKKGTGTLALVVWGKE